MFDDGDQKPETGEAVLADDGIGCGKEFDDELEEGEIVDDDSDGEPEKFEKNHSCGYFEHSQETEQEREILSYGSPAYDSFPKNDCMPDSRGNIYRGMKRRNADYYLTNGDDCWAEDDDISRNNKRRRSTENDEIDSELRNERFSRQISNNEYAAPITSTEPGYDSYNDRETMYGCIEPELYPRPFENERRDFRPLRHNNRYGRIRGDGAGGGRYEINNAPATLSTMQRPRRRSDVETTRRGQKIMELCRFYRLNRRCYKQDWCTYMHGEFPCKFHHTGKRCYWGEKCRYSHAEIDVNLKKLLLKNAFEEHVRPPFVQSIYDVNYNDEIPSLLEMQIPVPTGLIETSNSNNIMSSTSRLELIVDDNISVSKEDVTAAHTVCLGVLSDDLEESSDDEMNKLVIDEDD